MLTSILLSPLVVRHCDRIRWAGPFFSVYVLFFLLSLAVVRLSDEISTRFFPLSSCIWVLLCLRKRCFRHFESERESPFSVNALGAEWSSDWSQMSTNVAALRRVREALNTLAKMPTSIPQ